jgi:ribonuclease E
MGLLVRTEAEGMPEEAILEDLELLQKQWESIQQEAVSTRPPSLLNRDDDFIQRVLRDVDSADVNRIVVDSHTGLKRVKQHLLNWSNGRSPQGVLIDHHRDRIPILEYFRVNAAIREALKPRVDLPSGGYIIIERTEALTVIDVNSGSFTRSATARETVLWTNCEAATEIARQLRLRNIAGVIIVDFIDMDSRRDQLQVLEQFNKALKADKARPQIAQLSELGLVELTRKRQGQNIYELFGRTCPSCGGLGHLVHLPGEAELEAPEPVEPLRAFTAPEPRPASGRDTWEKSSGDDLDLEPAADLQELDLTNHPNYQERSKGDSRRRRRSRLKVGEPVTRGVAKPPLPELDGEDPVPEEVTASPTPNRGTREGRPDKPERGRSPRREKLPAEPPQVISVEMTPEEQDVYALMGISPLVLATETVKDTKSTLISVTLPGQSSRSPSETTTHEILSALPAKVSGVTAVDPDDRDEPVVTRSIARNEPPVLNPGSASSDLTETVDLSPAPVNGSDGRGEVHEEEATEENLSAETEVDTTRRRRRRRSSVGISGSS